MTGGGEILLLGMGEGGTLQLVDSWEWVNNGQPPVRNAEEVELVLTDGHSW